MKISALTITLIIFTLVSLSIFFLYKGLFNIQDKFCNELEPNQSGNYSEWKLKMWKDCFFSRQDLHIKYGLTMFTSTILIFLTILSWKVDHIMENKK